MNGFLVIDKPAGITSHDVVAAVRRVTGVKKVGHTGTLDPFATGVLPLALGRSTRLIQFLDESIKVYDATIRFGTSTNTGDPTGEVATTAELPDADEADVIRVLDGFLGEREQEPPAFSAVKVAGKPMYHYARKGQTVSQATLLVEVWGYSPKVSSRAAYHAVARLRQRLEPDPTHPRYLVTVRGKGFKLELDDAPPPRAGTVRTAVRLPRRRTVFFGRTQERDTVIARLRSSPTPVVSLVGLGGVGKSRLAVEICHALIEDYDHLTFSDLTDVEGPDELLATLARTLRVPLSREGLAVRTLARHLDARGATLLVLDNIDRCADAVADLAMALIDGCSRLTLLVTGRRGLDLHGECQILLDVLPLPEPDAPLADVAANEAVQLFVDRVGLKEPFDQTSSNVDQVEAIVRRLEGWPLALELAAAQVPVAGLDWLAEPAVDVRSLRATTRDRPRRQRTVHDVLDLTWELLDRCAREAWIQLSWFRGGFTLAAAEAVVETTTPMPVVLATLRERGIVRRVGQEPQPRFGMLEPVREWARERLGPTPEVAERHLAWAVALQQILLEQAPSDHTTAIAIAEFENLELAWETAREREDGHALPVLALCLTSSGAWSSASSKRRIMRSRDPNHHTERVMQRARTGNACPSSRSRAVSHASSRFSNSAMAIAVVWSDGACSSRICWSAT
ncbi:MAG: tRNA pseudouridine(55) synthase TruB, partial [Myxococcota bacterium]